MTLEVRQSCDICGNIRAFSVLNLRRFVNVQEASQTQGWVCLDRDKNKHMCPSCVKDALKKAKPPTGASIIEVTTIKEQ